MTNEQMFQCKGIAQAAGTDLSKLVILFSAVTASADPDTIEALMSEAEGSLLALAGHVREGRRVYDAMGGN